MGTFRHICWTGRKGRRGCCALRYEILQMVVQNMTRMCTHHAMELAPFVALRPTSRVLGLARAELAEVLCSLGRHVGEEFHLRAMVKKKVSERAKTTQQENTQCGRSIIYLDTPERLACSIVEVVSEISLLFDWLLEWWKQWTRLLR